MFNKDAEEARRIYDIYGEYFVQIEEHNPNRKQLSKILSSMIEDVKGKKILDAGCGAGNDSEILAERGARVVGIDVSHKMIEMARKRCKNFRVDFYIEDMERTRFQDKEFDILIAVFSILYKKNLKKVIEEFKRILKDEGELYLVVSHPISKMIKHTKNYFDTGKHWKFFEKIKFFNYHRTMEEYINTLTSQGFVIKEIREPKPVTTSENFFPHYLIIKSVNG